MKIAITAELNRTSANVDPRFARCSYFAIYDTETDKVEFLVNEVKNAKDGAGPAAVRFLATNNIKRIYAGEFGSKIISLLDELKIESIKVSNQTIEEIIHQIKNS